VSVALHTHAGDDIHILAFTITYMKRFFSMLPHMLALSLSHTQDTILKQNTHKTDTHKQTHIQNHIQAMTQQLDDISGEFDPITDADSNYGRVLGLSHISRTNGVIPEDMDISPERKAPVQMLYDVDGPQNTDPSYGTY